MFKKHKFPLSLMIVLLILSFSALTGRTLALSQHRQAAEIQLLSPKHGIPQVAAPITLQDAWELVTTEARDWQSEATVVSLHSIDHPNDSETAGRDGRRRAWQAVLLSDNETSVERVITLIDGVIQEDIQQSGGSGARPGLERPQTDSPEMLQRALEFRPVFTPEEGKGRGFHFVLGQSPGERPVVTVRGSYRNLPAIVSFEASTGALLEAKAIGFEAGGLLYSWDTGRTWHASNLVDETIMAVSPDSTVSGQAYAVALHEQGIVVYRTENRGENWSHFGTLPAAAGDWPFDVEVAVDSSGNATVLVGTWTGIWRSTDGKQWSSLAGLPDGPKQWLSVAHSPQGDRLFVTITAGEEPGVYASGDFSSWTRVTDAPLRLSKSFDAKTVLATNERAVAPAWLLSSQGEAQVEMEVTGLRAAGDFDSGIFAVQSTREGTWYRSLQGKDWTLSVPLASLAASPEFPNNHVIVAGGFRTGIYRSQDAGRSWELVLSNPAQIVPGNNEIYDVAFLTKDAVLAVNGSILAWEDF